MVCGRTLGVSCCRKPEQRGGWRRWAARRCSAWHLVGQLGVPHPSAPPWFAREPRSMLPCRSPVPPIGAARSSGRGAAASASGPGLGRSVRLRTNANCRGRWTGEVRRLGRLSGCDPRSRPPGGGQGLEARPHRPSDTRRRQTSALRTSLGKLVRGEERHEESSGAWAKNGAGTWSRAWAAQATLVAAATARARSGGSRTSWACGREPATPGRRPPPRVRRRPSHARHRQPARGARRRVSCGTASVSSSSRLETAFRVLERLSR